jgi:hypothetical protein
METAEVIAAAKGRPKNAPATIRPPGRSENAAGRVENASSVPSEGSRLNVKTMEKMTIPSLS